MEVHTVMAFTFKRWLGVWPSYDEDMADYLVYEVRATMVDDAAKPLTTVLRGLTRNQRSRMV